MTRHSPARFLAPAALVAAALAVFIVAFGGSDGSGDTPGTPATSGRTTPAKRSGTAKRKSASPTATATTTTGSATTPASASTTTTPAQDTYEVQAGDVLSTIAEKTGVPVEELQRLNPELDASALQPGQSLKLKP